MVEMIQRSLDQRIREDRSCFDRQKRLQKVGSMVDDQWQVILAGIAGSIMGERWLNGHEKFCPFLHGISPW
jgi:hypothetical protein